MYLPKHFEETRPEILRGLIEAHPLGTLVTLTPGGLEANHIPFEFDDGPPATLTGHVARANPLWSDFLPDTEALVIFQGPGTYVSPAWYPAKAAHGRVVPTWNYTAVHAYGRIRAVEDPRWLRRFVERLTNRHEADRPGPWKVSDAPAEYVDRMLGAIVGLEITVSRLVGKWKMSQNRDAADRQGVARALRESDEASTRAMADLIERSGPA